MDFVRILLAAALTASLLIPGICRAASWPDLTQPPASHGGGEKDAALVVGIENYVFVPHVAGAADNARAWYAYLTKTLGVPASRARLLLDSEAALESVKQAAKDAAARVQPGGTLWVIFIGLLFYKRGDRTEVIDRIQPDCKVVQATQPEAWTAGWTNFVPIELAGQPHLFLYKVGDGTADLERAGPDGQLTTLWKETWKPGWTTQASLVLDGVAYLLSYQVQSARVAIDRIAPDGKLTTVYQGTWSKGWTTISPYTIAGHLQYITYKVDTGEAAIDEVTPR